MAIQQGTVTITGFVGSMPVPFGRSGGVEGCSFRMGSTRRYRDGGTGESDAPAPSSMSPLPLSTNRAVPSSRCSR